MRILSLIIITVVVFYVGLFSASSNVRIYKKNVDSPHGKAFNISCSTCHSAKSWKIDPEIYSFNHSNTKMPLVGQHKSIDCKSCHSSLVFSDEKSKNECVSCHSDLHQQTVGNFCDKCHSPSSWIVNDIKSIHQQSRFPLLGVHTMTECQKCHSSESLHQYNVLGVECIDCHRDNYFSTTNPNHNLANFSTECTECHYIFAYEWSGTGFNHSIFPLTQGHANVDCAKCHVNNNYTNTSTECVSCHLSDYNGATNPVHTSGCYPKNCATCHTTSPGWSPVNFQHDNYFPISSGNHSGISCVECHTDPNNCEAFSCIDCHEHNQSSMDNEHEGESGYSFNSAACLNCHPQGNKH